MCHIAALLFNFATKYRTSVSIDSNQTVVGGILEFGRGKQHRIVTETQHFHYFQLAAFK